MNRDRNFTYLLCGLGIFMAVFVLGGIILIITLPPGSNARRGLEGLVGPKTLPPSQSPTLSPTRAPTPIPAGFPTPVPTTAAPTGAPTSAPTWGPLMLTCPPPTSVTLGKPYNVDVTGNAISSGGCNPPGVIVFSNDTVVGTISRRSKSLSFPTSNLVIQNSRTDSFVGAAGDSAANVQVVLGAESENQLILLRAHSGGTFVTVVEQSDVSSVLGSFVMNTKGSCSAGVATEQARGRALYDFDVGRWIMLERGLANNTMCFYLSDSADILTASWEVHPIEFTSAVLEARIGLWNRAYPMTLRGPLESLCVIDRLTLLGGGNFTLFCKEPTPFTGGTYLSGFPPESQMWTPVTVKNGPMPPQATEASGSPGIGAVFVRHNDNELHNPMAAPTPLFDFVGVEHWANINFGTQFRQTVRYQTQVSDFDSSFAGCTSIDRCIDTPNVLVKLNPIREYIVSDATYRFLPACDNQQSLVMAWTSHANGVNVSHVFWAEMRFRRATITSEPTFVREQDGLIGPAFLPAIAMDPNGTIALTYSSSSSSVWPTAYVRTRLRNDPVGSMRNPLQLIGGDSYLPNTNNDWGRYVGAAATDHSREFFTGSVVSATATDEYKTHASRLRVTGDQILRNFYAVDGCNVIETCSQMIELK